jgi:hypothetical protein
MTWLKKVTYTYTFLNYSYQCETRTFESYVKWFYLRYFRVVWDLKSINWIPLKAYLMSKDLID